MTKIPGLFWVGAVPLYFMLAFNLLWDTYPISVDGGGPSATFGWACKTPVPSLQEYAENYRLRLPFRYPYLLAAGILTLLGIPGPRLLRSPIAAGCVSLLSMLIATAISDVGSALDWWCSGRAFAWSMNSLVPLARIVGALSITSGLLVLAERRLAGKQAGDKIARPTVDGLH